MQRYLPFVIAAALFAGGCGKKDDAPPAAPSPPVTSSADSRVTTVTPPPPRGDTAKGAEGQAPKPGQANDHSSPEFKGGGEPDKKR